MDRIPQDVKKMAEDRKNDKASQWPWVEQEDIHPIHYVNFSEYVKSITKRDNWREAFSEHFGDRNIISSKLRELDPIRNKIAHMRELTEAEKSKLQLYSTEIVNCIFKK